MKRHNILIGLVLFYQILSLHLVQPTKMLVLETHLSRKKDFQERNCVSLKLILDGILLEVRSPFHQWKLNQNSPCQPLSSHPKRNFKYSNCSKFKEVCLYQQHFPRSKIQILQVAPWAEKKEPTIPGWMYPRTESINNSRWTFNQLGATRPSRLNHPNHRGQRCLNSHTLPSKPLYL